MDAHCIQRWRPHEISIGLICVKFKEAPWSEHLTDRAESFTEQCMPVARYFLLVGGALLSLLLVLDVFLPRAPAKEHVEAVRPTIRIYSDRKPDRVEFGGNTRTFVAPDTTGSRESILPPPTVDHAAKKAQTRGSFAQLRPKRKVRHAVRRKHVVERRVAERKAPSPQWTFMSPW
jgi:hypothetical protein